MRQLYSLPSVKIYAYSDQILFWKGDVMKSKLNNLYLTVTHLDRQHIQVFLLLLSLSMLVIGAGAPMGSGGGTP